ncbi:hypothetical protein PN36_25125 [Candidatus Thiomargarita nelsonii]|uniref:Uncharacterized protein n=1 Tax=Candidatus Thiomargarita nelsonii TaxID=1003181 RepID=A0A0A6P2M0_9GAMM|nr:hypothetical protein PN36_25125 [Candidatus Thiomargarita nelsonii]
MDILWQYPNPEWVPVSHCDKPRYESIEIWGKVRQLVFNLQKRIYKALLLRNLVGTERQKA